MSESRDEVYLTGRLQKNSSHQETSDAMDLVYLMLGRALSDWGKVEKSLCKVFESCFPLLNSAPAGHAFFEPRSFKTQLNMTSRAVLVAAQGAEDADAITGEWLEIFDTTETASLKRNKLAHGSVVCNRDFSDDYFLVRFEAFHSAVRHNQSAQRNLKKEHLKGLWGARTHSFLAHELNEMSADFHIISKSLDGFARKLSASIHP